MIGAAFDYPWIGGPDEAFHQHVKMLRELDALRARVSEEAPQPTIEALVEVAENAEHFYWKNEWISGVTGGSDGARLRAVTAVAAALGASVPLPAGAPPEGGEAPMTDWRAIADGLATELRKWGWGDFHYGSQGQERSVLEALAPYDAAVAAVGSPEGEKTP